MTAADMDVWDEWEDGDDTAASPLQSSTRFIEPALSLPKDGEWGFDLSELEYEMMNLPPTVCAPPFSSTDDTHSSEEKLVSVLDRLFQDLHDSEERVRTLQALALVTRLHVVAARGSFVELSNDAQSTQEELKSIDEELEQLAGEWGDKELLETMLRPSERQRLDEMTGLLHHALSAENKDLILFQEVVEQIFDGLPSQKLVLSSNWLSTAEAKEEMETTSYLKQVLANFSDSLGNSRRMPTLSDADISQDAKDISRDELLINGERVKGTRGYDAVVDALQRELELVLARQVDKTPERTPMDMSNALHAVAMAVVHASNRTESGGSCYELLGKFLSNHEMDRVLLRPDSARAAPLEIHLDMGPYLEAISGSNEFTWAFGLRAKLIASTWYLICDAEDPTTELYEVETTFCNRLAFPVGLTPFRPLDSMRKDRGDVIVRLLPT